MLKDESKVPVCITLVKETTYNQDQPTFNKFSQIKCWFDKDKSFKEQAVSFLRNLNEQPFYGRVTIIVSKFDKTPLVEMHNLDVSDIRYNAEEYFIKFKNSETKVEQFDVWVKSQIDYIH